jgi:hypothetical protein
MSNLAPLNSANSNHLFYSKMPIKPREIWEKATPLSEAWLAFSDSKLRKKYQMEKGPPNLPNFDSIPTGFEKTMVAIEAGIKIATSPQRQKQLALEMQTQLVGRLKNNRLIAVAYPLRPSPARMPRYIGSEFWASAQINWDAQSAQDQSAEFHRIRIFNPGKFPAFELNRRTGRKTNKQLIDWAISEIRKANPKFKDQVHKAKCDRIREFIRSNCKGIEPTGRGWGDDAIRKHITAYFGQNGIAN